MLDGVESQSDDEQAFDADKWLADFYAGQEETRKLRERRPSRAMTMEALANHANLLSLSLQIERQQKVPAAVAPSDDGYADFWFPAPRSAAESDIEWAALLPAPWEENPVKANLDLVRRFTSASIDHLSGLAILMGSDLARSPLAAGRAATEAFATAAIMADSSVGSRERLRRGLNLRLHELEEKRRDRVGDLKLEIEQEIRAILSASVTSGFSAKWQPNLFHRIPNAHGQSDSPAWIIGELLEQQHEVGSSLWRTMSGGVHSRDDVTYLLLWDWNGYSEPRVRDSEVAFSTIGAVLAAVLVVPRLATYLGWDLDVLEEPGRTLIAVWNLAAGMGDHLLQDEG